MTIRKLASEIAKREGKKSQARIGDIREILKILCTIEAEELVDQGKPFLVTALIDVEVNKIAERLRKKLKKGWAVMTRASIEQLVVECDTFDDDVARWIKEVDVMPIIKRLLDERDELAVLEEENARLKAENYVRKDAALRAYDGLAQKAGRVDELQAECEKLRRENEVLREVLAKYSYEKAHGFAAREALAEADKIRGSK